MTQDTIQDAGCRIKGQKSEDRRQRSEVRRQKSEVRYTKRASPQNAKVEQERKKKFEDYR
ncbi:MAG: Av71 muscle cell intermediate filament [Deltaproteobacteria bacterium HGW-Deltaproteobacteria-15]|nr:MAG: Av71 muscle cell intermediate filament [Deltaproteobacteria bacterium HGW-Deltaproteobacteria-15]